MPDKDTFSLIMGIGGNGQRLVRFGGQVMEKHGL
jgi:hypothetical protein